MTQSAATHYQAWIVCYTRLHAWLFCMSRKYDSHRGLILYVLHLVMRQDDNGAILGHPDHAANVADGEPKNPPAIEASFVRQGRARRRR